VGRGPETRRGVMDVHLLRGGARKCQYYKEKRDSGGQRKRRKTCRVSTEREAKSRKKAKRLRERMEMMIGK